MCFVVRVNGAAFPDRVSINSFKMQPDAPALAFSLGIDRDGEHRADDLAALKHLLLVGATGGGKTTFIHAMLYWLISRNSDQDIELWLIDLKNGAELGRYEALKNSKANPHGIVRQLATEPEAAIDVLNLALHEIRRRNDLMRRHSASNIDDLAHVTGQRLRRVVVVIDEIAMLMLNRNKLGQYSIGSWGENLMTQIASLGRSAGVHLVIATQMINKEVLSSLILANFENRLCFSVADWRKSQLAIETSEASGLPVGRAVMRREGQIAEYQTCLITPQQTRLEIERIRRHGPAGGLGEQNELARFARDAKLLLALACEQFSGEFSRSKLLDHPDVRNVIGQPRFHEIARRLESDGVLEPGRGKYARRVARGYFGRPHLLDVLYGANSNDLTAPEQQETEKDCSYLAVRPDLSHQSEEKLLLEDSDLAVSSLGEQASHDLDPANPNDERIEPEWLRDVLDRMEPRQPPES
jgi:DNA segregation ATPase FtsK/SpoIIIE-like protein